MSQEKIIQVERDILSKNDRLAAANRAHLAQRGIFALNFVSSPGSGKTTLLARMIRELKERMEITVIEGDQQTSNDAMRIREAGARAVQINTGKGCHLDAHMVGHAIETLEPAENSVLFIENVGNLVCPAAFDLGEAHKVAVLSVTEGEDKPLKYPDMFAAADIMVLNKSDLLPHLDFNTGLCIANAMRVNPSSRPSSSRPHGEGMEALYAWLEASAARRAGCRKGRLNHGEPGHHLDAEAGERAIRRFRLRVRGVVQGVGFRPFAFALARQMGLSGFVLNDNAGVLIEVEGEGADGFARVVEADAPPLARIDAIEAEEIDANGLTGFEIRESVAGKSATRIGADAATCRECLDELFDPASRFFHYPFVNCTHCGPRLTITRRLPYTIARRRPWRALRCAPPVAPITKTAQPPLHAEPVACPACGPKLSHSVAEIAQAIRAGKIVALKGIGGFHLLCDAENASAIATLRQRKARDEKPFAVMLRDVAAARHFADLTDAETALLESPAIRSCLRQAEGTCRRASRRG